MMKIMNKLVKELTDAGVTRKNVIWFFGLEK